MINSAKALNGASQFSLSLFLLSEAVSLTREFALQISMGMAIMSKNLKVTKFLRRKPRTHLP